MIYVDLLVIEDLFLNYVILLTTGILLNRVTKFKKTFLASVIGTIPLILLFMNTSTLIIFLINFAFSIIMSIIAFKYKDIVYTLKNIIYMYFVSVFLAGGIYLINTNFFPKLDSHILKFIMLIIISPIITDIYIRIIKKMEANYSNYYLIDIYLKDKPKVTINSFLDTGNKLVDPYTKQPIILIDKQKINTDNEKKVLVPYNTIDNHGLLTCIIPEKIYIHKTNNYKKCLIGLIDNVGIDGAECILNSKILERNR